MSRPKEIQIWERMPGEPAFEFAVFENYLMLGPGRHTGKIKAIPQHRIGLIAKQWSWDIRADTYDAWISTRRMVTNAQIRTMREEAEFLRTRKLYLKEQVAIAQLENALEAAQRPTMSGEMGPREVVAILGVGGRQTEETDGTPDATPTDLKDVSTEKLEQIASILGAE